VKGSLVVLGILNYLIVALYTLITIIFDKSVAVTDFMVDIAMLLACLNICAFLISKIRSECHRSSENSGEYTSEIDMTVNDDDELRNILKDAIREEEEAFDEIRLEDINNIN